MLERGAAFLDKELVKEETSYDQQAWMLHALAAHHFGFADKAKILVQNLENGVKRENAPDTSLRLKGEPKSDAATMVTAHWGEDGMYWRWSEGGVETTAWALSALLAIEPRHKLIEPVTNCLLKNRRGAQWSNTCDTAMVVLGHAMYVPEIRCNGEEMKVVVVDQPSTESRRTHAYRG